MSFIWIEMLWLLLLVPALIITYILLQRRWKKYALRYASLSLVKEALGRGPGVRRHIPPALCLLGMIIIIVAAARPAATVMIPSKQATVILTIDVSGSMRADDMKPSRLEAAKAASRVFVESQPKNVRIGVVSFSDVSAVVQAPTIDREAVLAAINRLTTQRGTGIGRGILTSLDAILEVPGTTPTPLLTPQPFGRGGPSLTLPTPTFTPVPRGSYTAAVIILLSDGMNNVAPAPLQIIDQAANRGIRVYTVGMGNPAGVVLSFDGRAMRVRLDEDTLKAIAENTGASYFKADSETDLRDINGHLSTNLVLKPKQTDLTAGFAGAAGIFFLIAGSFSMLWFNRLP